MNDLLMKRLLRSSPSESGFSMFEVLISIMVTSAFVLGTLQAMAINSYLQVKAEREAQANFWIQEDLELVKSEAGNTTDGDLPDNICKRPRWYQRFGVVLRQKKLYEKLASEGKNLSTADPITTPPNAPPSQTFQVVETRKLVNKDYRLVRITSVETKLKDADMLKITYRVGVPDDSDTQDRIKDNADGNTSIIAENYAEVIPSQAYNCSG